MKMQTDSEPKTVIDAFASFPAIVGNNSGSIFFTTIWTYQTLFRFTDLPNTRNKIKKQEKIDTSLVREIFNHISNSEQFLIPSLPVSINHILSFNPIAEEQNTIGILKIPLDGEILVSDRLEWWLAIRQTIEDQPEFSGNTVPVAIFPNIEANLKP